jgi:hypothetical protein
MRAQNVGWEEIRDAMDSWSLAKLRTYVRKTEPPAPLGAPARPEPPAPPDPPALEGEPVPRHLPPPRVRRADPPLLDEASEGEDGSELEDGTHFVMTTVLPGLALFLRRDASPLVKRVAAEILRRYRAR